MMPFVDLALKRNFKHGETVQESRNYLLLRPGVA